MWLQVTVGAVPANVKLPDPASPFVRTPGSPGAAASAVSAASPSAGEVLRQLKASEAKAGAARAGRRWRGGLGGEDVPGDGGEGGHGEGGQGGGGGGGGAAVRAEEVLARLAARVARPPKLQVVLTKCDLVERHELARRVAVVSKQLSEQRGKQRGDGERGRVVKKKYSSSMVAMAYSAV